MSKLCWVYKLQSGIFQDEIMVIDAEDMTSALKQLGQHIRKTVQSYCSDRDDYTSLEIKGMTHPRSPILKLKCRTAYKEFGIQVVQYTMAHSISNTLPTVQGFTPVMFTDDSIPILCDSIVPNVTVFCWELQDDEVIRTILALHIDRDNLAESLSTELKARGMEHSTVNSLFKVNNNLCIGIGDSWFCSVFFNEGKSNE